MSLNEFGKKTNDNIVVNVINKPSSGDEVLSSSGAEEKVKGPVQWAIVGPGEYISQGKTVAVLPANFYTVTFSNDARKAVFKETDVKYDALTYARKGMINNIITEIELFWKKEQKFKELGYLHYRGYLFYGAHGSGKTSLIQLIAKDFIKEGGVVFMCNSDNIYSFIDCVKDFRKVEPDRKIICLFEDIDVLAKNNESMLLSFLDGEYKIDKVLNIATTNYPELLDKRIVARPRRFDRVIKIDYPGEEERLIYFKSKFDALKAKQWAKKTEGLSFASLAELVVSVECLDKDLDETIVLLKDMQTIPVSSDGLDGKQSTGFN